jgi:hypothetical protein
MNSLQNRTINRITALLVFTVIFIGLSLIPISDDYRYYTIPTRNWASGESLLYDENSLDFYYMPWSLIITLPLAFLPDHLGQALLDLVSLGLIFIAVKTIAGKLKWWQWFLLLCNLFIVNLMFTAQWDAIALGGVAISWWGVITGNPWLCGAGFMMAMTKPTNVILPVIIILISGFQHCDPKFLARAALIPLVLLISSFFACRYDWPIRYLHFIQIHPPREYYNISLWKVGAEIGMPTWLIFGICVLFLASFTWIAYRRKADAITLAAALVVNMVISPYMVSYHIIGTSPALGWILRRKWIWGVGIYLVMFVIFLGVADILKSPPIVIYPLTVMIVTLVLATKA